MRGGEDGAKGPVEGSPPTPEDNSSTKVSKKVNKCDHSVNEYDNRGLIDLKKKKNHLLNMDDINDKKLKQTKP